MKSRLLTVRPGHTLLEVLLALSICTVLVAILWTTIDVQLRATDAGRVNMEQAQLARAILRRIADDLRSAVRYEPIDVASLVSMPELPADLAGALQGATGGTSGGSGGQSGSLPGGMSASSLAAAAGSSSGSVPGTEEEDAGTAADQTSTAESAVPPPIPGIYGDQYGIQIDVARLPRMDQYNSWSQNVSGNFIRDRASDLKTVAYFVVEPGRGSLSSAVGTAASANNGGMVRRELDRAVTMWAAENGNLAMLDNTGELLAPEVLALEFSYFDGTSWNNYWDSSEREGLPVAVQIAMAVGPPRTVSDNWEEEQPMRLLIDELEAQRDSRIFIYRLTVHLPAGLPAEIKTATEDGSTENTDSEDSTTGSSSNQSNSSNSGGSSNSSGSGSRSSGGSSFGSQNSSGNSSSNTKSQ